MNLCVDCTEIEFNIHFTIAAMVNVYNFPFAFYYFTEKHLMDPAPRVRAWSELQQTPDCLFILFAARSGNISRQNCILMNIKAATRELLLKADIKLSEDGHLITYLFN